MIASAMTSAERDGVHAALARAGTDAIWSKKEPEAVASAASSVSRVKSPTVIDASSRARRHDGHLCNRRATQEPWNSGGREGASSTSRRSKPVKKPR